MTRRLLLGLAMLGVLAACGTPPGETSVRLAVGYETVWALTGLEVRADEGRDQTEAAPTVRVLVPDAWAGQPLELAVIGLRGEEAWAAGRVEVTPELGREVSANVTLARLPCGAWCTAGATACSGGGTVVCEERDDDQCLEWSEPIVCPPEAPACSLGACAATCVDECAEGEARCDGPDGLRTCGQADGDACLDWLPALACGDGETCSLGQCRAACVDECADGAVACLGAGTVRCDDRNFDGCLEWGPVEACPDGETCSNGVCSTTCEDECTVATCDGLVYRVCGNFDFDPCADLSPGTSCAPADPCVEGACMADGCASAPKVCDEPPGGMCLDDETMRVYDAVGVCEAGACTYASQDVACPDCPACDACAAVTCDQPPSVCYATPGTCSDGSCSYPPADGATCDDGNACTTGDDCQAGVCAGTPVVCTSPPAPVCVDATTRRTYSGPGVCTGGACSYPFADMTCAGICQNGACSCDDELVALGAGFISVEFTMDAAGRLYAIGEPLNGPLMLFTKVPGGSWSSPVDVDLGTDTVGVFDVAADAAGGLHLIYAQGSGYELKHAYRAPGSGTFQRTLVDNVPQQISMARLVVDAAGAVHALYYANAALYAQRAAGSTTWQSSTLDDSADDQGGCFGLAVDEDEKVHVVYSYDAGVQGTPDRLTYARRNTNGTWFTEPVGVDYPDECSIAVDDSGGLHLGYSRYHQNGQKLAYAYKPAGGSWDPRVFDTPASEYSRVVTGIGGGLVHLGYQGESEVRHVYGVPADTSWSLDSVTTSSYDLDLEVEATGVAHFAIGNYDQGGQYARRCP